MPTAIDSANLQAIHPSISSPCAVCRHNHILPVADSRRYAKQLMDTLEAEGRLDFLASDGFCDQSNAPSSSPTDSLFGKARGKMFGVLHGIDAKGRHQVLYAFSGQFLGQWNIAGWAPPLFDETIWHSVNDATERHIQRLGRDMDLLPEKSVNRAILAKNRKMVSRRLMEKLHSLYRLRNFRGEISGLAPFFQNRHGIPTGTGDCCAPKLLNFALQKNITPLGIAEFYWGRPNKSGSRRHGRFYPACTDKCRPLLGFMLCGLQKRWSQLDGHRAGIR
ncbi:MAG: hypothetical protein ABR512_01600 [Desulfopila sp.]